MRKPSRKKTSSRQVKETDLSEILRETVERDSRILHETASGKIGRTTVEIPPRSAEASPAGLLWEIGTTLINEYRVEGHLGQGGMGIVYLVSDCKAPDRFYAVKTCRASID